MIDYLLTILSCSLFCVGLWAITDDGMILHPLKVLADKYLPIYLYKPLVGCVVCYGSIWGGSLYYLITGDATMIIPAMVSISGLNYLIVSKYA